MECAGSDDDHDDDGWRLLDDVSLGVDAAAAEAAAAEGG